MHKCFISVINQNENYSTHSNLSSINHKTRIPNNSNWRDDWNLVGNELRHTSGLIFVITSKGDSVDVVAKDVALAEFQRKEFAAGKSPDEVLAFIKGVSQQIQPYYYEVTTGNKTRFEPLH